MESLRESSFGANHKPSVLCKNGGAAGKENFPAPSTCRPQNKQKQTLQDIKLNDQQKSKLPVLSKAKPPPDFQKMHQVWQNQFQKGKAMSKKSCTRPQPFNLSQKGDRFSVTPITDVGHPVSSSFTNNLQSPPSSHTSREPLSEVCLGQKNLGNRAVQSKDVPGDEFKADPAALASILSNTGVSNIGGGMAGKLSLAHRVPMRASSAVPNNKSTVMRGSLYTASCSQRTNFVVGRMSCMARPPGKGEEQKNHFGLKPQSKPKDTTIREFPASKEDCMLQPQVNPVLQQMNAPSHPSDHNKHSQTFIKPELPAQKPSSSKLPENGATSESSSTKIESTEKEDAVKELMEKTDLDSGSGEFVADSQALASILSNTGVTVTNVGKLSLAQRVPVQGKNISFKNTMPASIAAQSATPKPPFGRMSAVPNALSLKDVTFSPCRVLMSKQTPSPSTGSSARRINNVKSSVVKFSQNIFSFNIRQPVFPKTPKALALEMANKCFEAECPDPRTTKSSVKWADDLSPTSEVFCEKQPDLDHVAMRLFVDGECTNEADKKEGSASTPETITLSRSKTLLDKETQDGPVECDVASAHNPHTLPLNFQSEHLGVQQPSTTVASLPTSSIALEMRTSLPFSFLSHPAVQALQSNSFGPQSLPHIARLRLNATVSAKKRFWDTCLDDECAFYTSMGAPGSYRTCVDPVASSLEKQENMHFIPISPAET
ncbi:tastin [Spea bombifrons]|uniref:tastin n=1 Tax=Spea bombifrons TaxID=233779 RepID=UPI00234958CC|nr:tastin [Spea bombifrons]